MVPHRPVLSLHFFFFIIFSGCVARGLLTMGRLRRGQKPQLVANQQENSEASSRHDHLQQFCPRLGAES